MCVIVTSLDVQFSRKQMISSIRFYNSHALDSTYSPLLVSILHSQDGQTYTEFKTFTIREMNDWYTVGEMWWNTSRSTPFETIILFPPSPYSSLFMKCITTERIQGYDR